MKVALKALLFMIIFSACGLTANAAEAGTRVAVVRIQAVFEKSEYAKQMETKIRARFRQDEKDIQDLERSIRTQKEQLSSEAFVAPDSLVYKEKVLRIQIQELQYQDKVKRFSMLNRTKMAEFWRSVYADFQKAIAHMSSTGKYDLILTASDINLPDQVMQTNSPEAVLNAISQRRIQYIRSQIDITDQIIKLMNAINAKRAK